MFSKRKISFKSITKRDLNKILTWRNSTFIRSNMLNQNKISYKSHLDWYKGLKKNKTQKSFMIYYEKTQIGLASIKQIDTINKTCTWGYYIANNSYRYLAVLVEYKFINLIFEKIKIRKIWWETLSFNKRILKIHKFLGFLIEGTYKEHIKVKNKYVDIVLTSLFKEDWKKSKKKLLLSLKIKK